MDEESEGTENQTSEWNEQIGFSRLFFGLSQVCRQHQMNDNYIGWKNSLMAKISHIQGIINDKERNEINKHIDKLNKHEGTLKRDRTSILKLNPSDRLNIESQLISALFNCEACVDKAVNNHMPFLNKRPEIDIGGL